MIESLASVVKWALAAASILGTVVLLLAAVLPVRRWRDEVGP
jgi:hypothetical protein